MVRINGEDFDVGGNTLMTFLEDSDYDIAKLAVEINDKIVPKREYANTTLQDGDKVEIVSFVGGG